MYDQFKIGHYTDRKNLTGCSVILCPDGTTASCAVVGSAPGSRELALLHPERKIQHIHALFLTGGSAFGLDATAGVSRFLEEQGIGYETPFAKIPLIPAAVVFDLYLGDPSVRPTADNAYTACRSAKAEFDERGSIGAGTGVTVGKWAGLEQAMKGGIGIAEVEHGDVKVRALSVVNSVGDVIDEQGDIIAGAVDKNGSFIAAADRQIRWTPPQVGMAENTVLSVIMTNARLTKMQAHALSKRSLPGLNRAIIPSGTSFDGDVIFTLANGKIPAHFDTLCEMAGEALRRAIINAVREAESLAGVPALKSFGQR